MMNNEMNNAVANNAMNNVEGKTMGNKQIINVIVIGAEINDEGKKLIWDRYFGNDSKKANAVVNYHVAYDADEAAKMKAELPSAFGEKGNFVFGETQVVQLVKFGYAMRVEKPVEETPAPVVKEKEPIKENIPEVIVDDTPDTNEEKVPVDYEDEYEPTDDEYVEAEDDAQLEDKPMRMSIEDLTVVNKDEIDFEAYTFGGSIEEDDAQEETKEVTPVEEKKPAEDVSNDADEIAALKAEIEALKAENLALKTDNAKKDETIKILTAEKNEAVNKLSGADETIKKLTVEVNTSKDTISDLSSKLDAANASLQKGRDLYSAMKKERDTAKEEIETLKKDAVDVKALNDKIKMLEANNKKFTMRSLDLSLKLNNANETIEKLSSELDKVNSQLKEVASKCYSEDEEF